MSKIQCWCRANAMLAISLLAAVVTAFFVPPDRDYLGYYDLKTLSCLFSCFGGGRCFARPAYLFCPLPADGAHFFHGSGRVYGISGYYYVRFYASDQRYRFVDLPAAGLVCPFLHKSGQAYCAPFHPAKLRR